MAITALPPKEKKKAAPKPRKISQGELLFHAVHGLCRVDRVNREKIAGKETYSYELVPKVPNKMRMRYVISENDLVMSGFHELFSVKEAGKILNYFKAGDVERVPTGVIVRDEASFAQETQPWNLAQAILSFSQEKDKLKDQRKLQILERSAKGLVGELSCVLNVSLKKSVEMVKKSLGNPSRVNPQVLAALELVCEE
jgi:RNA polymerase-interacting CarD/CdnL/TRCF family regulator